MELVVGSTKRQFSLGRDSEAVRTQIDKQKALFTDAVPDLKQREKPVAMLISDDACTHFRSFPGLPQSYATP